MIEGFEEFEELLSRCLSSEKHARPLNAIVLRDEPVFEEFLHRIEAGERPSDMFVPPEEIIRRLRDENKKQSDEIKQLQERIKFFEQEDSTIDILQLNMKPGSYRGFGFQLRGGGGSASPIVVDSVKPGGAAHMCELSVGDEVLQMNGMTVTRLTQKEIIELLVEAVRTGLLRLRVRRINQPSRNIPV